MQIGGKVNRAADYEYSGTTRPDDGEPIRSPSLTVEEARVVLLLL